MAAPIGLHLEFGGGAELLFDGVKNHHITLPDRSDPWDMKQLLVWIRGNMLKERPELFLQGDTVRPGILVLINEADWELMGELEYQLQDKDNVASQGYGQEQGLIKRVTLSSQCPDGIPREIVD
ncbi:hypothetical protein DNTS_026688, partial [Danionella cerebrum]